jgi:hypothetical protein
MLRDGKFEVSRILHARDVGLLPIQTLELANFAL